MTTEHMEELNDQQIVRRERWRPFVNKESTHLESDSNELQILVN